MILREALAAGVARLRDGGIDDPTRDARALMAAATGIPVSRISLEPDFELDADMWARFDQALARRIAHEPVSRILGFRHFWGRDFAISPDTLDPRPETESLIAAAIETGPARRLADLGTGSGIIAISLLLEWPDATGFATDISPAALTVAQANTQALGAAGRLQMLAVDSPDDWFGDLPGGLDLIVSNPPYISQAEMDDLAPEVHGFDPHQALSPGGDGLAAYRAIASGARDHLTPGGRLMVEIGWQQGADVALIFADAGLDQIAVLPDLDGRDRVVTAVAPRA